MTTRVTATVVGGTLKLDQALPIADQTRVQLTVATLEDRPDAAAAIAAWEAIKARLRARPLHFGGIRYSRMKLHERH